MGDMKNTSIGYMAADRKIRLRWGGWKTVKADHRGTVLLLTGRGEYLEKYVETVDDLTLRGYDVYSLDWRGQGLSSRMLSNRQKGFVHTYDDYLSDLTHFVETVIKSFARPPFKMLAHSMGAHVGLRYLHDNPGEFHSAVLTAPLIDVAMPNALKTILKAYVKMAVKLGLGERYVPGAGDCKPGERRFRKNHLTSDRLRFERVNRQVRETPALALGGVTHQWLLATFRSIDVISRKDFLEEIDLPVLIVAAGNDSIVSLQAQAAAQGRLSTCTLVELNCARHEILIEADPFRQKFWRAFDQFI